MNASLPVPKLSPEEYLLRERSAANRSEYLDGAVHAMAGGSMEHSAIKINLAIEIGYQLRGKPCRPFDSDLKVWVSAAKAFFYPDMAFTCEQPLTQGDVLENPSLLIEVLSPSTERYDRTRKFDMYRKIPSFVQYALVSQDEPRVEVLTKSPEGFWMFTSYVGLTETVRLSSIGVELRCPRSTTALRFPKARMGMYERELTGSEADT